MPDIPDDRIRRWQRIYTAAIVAVSLPYLISFASQLCSDDFILLYYYGRRPLWRVWEFFAPRALWTYHPLQNYYYAIGWHVAGIEPWAYRAMALAFHLATALLLMKFGRDLTRSVHFGGCVAIAFAGQWRQWEAVAWAGSIATVQSTFFTMLACAAFLSFLRTRRWVHYALMVVAGAGWAVSKETIVQLPVFLAAIYLYWRWFETHAAEAGTAQPVAAQRSVVGDLVRLLAIPVVLVSGYLVFYVVCFRNVYTFAELGYERAPVRWWFAHVLAWLDRSLDPLLDNEVVEALGVLHPLAWVVTWHVVPWLALLLVLVFAVVRRRMLPLFASAMTLVGMMPYALLRGGFYGYRYHYAAMLGASLLAVGLGREFWRLTAGKRRGIYSWIRVVVAAGGGLWVVASFFQLSNVLLHDREANRVSRELFDFFAIQTDKADRPVLFVVDTRLIEKDEHVDIGWGLLECAKLALDSDTVAAVELGFDLDRHLLIEFNAVPEKYLVMRRADGWWADPLPGGSRLTIAPDGRGGVTLGNRF